MGGMNHQPCNKPGTAYLELSTVMSKALSIARSELELANAELENTLISEIQGGKVSTASLRSTVEHLGRSREFLAHFLQIVAELRRNMADNDFEDLPTLKTVDLERLGVHLAHAGYVDISAWRSIADEMNKNGFYGVLDHFRIGTHALMTWTDQLARAIVAVNLRLSSDTESVSVTGILEENRVGNFKQEFAELYIGWLRFQQEFLASSMLSTELWYRHQGVGSLLDQELAVERVA